MSLELFYLGCIVVLVIACINALFWYSQSNVASMLISIGNGVSQYCLCHVWLNVGIAMATGAVGEVAWTLA